MRLRPLAIAAIALAVTMGGTTLLQAQQAAMRSIWSGVYSEAQAARGKEAFEQNCAKCHGGQLQGMDEIPPLSGGHFMANWETQSVADLVQRIHNTMPMNNPGALSTARSTDVVAYLLSQNKIPAGAADLPGEASMLSQIRIDTNKPGTN